MHIQLAVPVRLRTRAIIVIVTALTLVFGSLVAPAHDRINQVGSFTNDSVPI